MNRLSPVILASLLGFSPCFAQGDLRIVIRDGDHHLQILGDPNEDWRILFSTDLKTWSQAPGGGAVLLSGEPGTAPLLRVDTIATQRYYKATRTEGLYDDTVLRTLSLTFEETNWQSRLPSNYDSGRNLLGTLDLGNGAHIESVGVRYRGNTSFSRSGEKKSINIKIDATDSTVESMRMERRTTVLDLTVDGVEYSLSGSRDLIGIDQGLVELTSVNSAGLPVLDDGWSYHTFRFSDSVTAMGEGFVSLSIAEPSG